VTRPDAYTVAFTAAARRGMNRLPAAAAVALFEHLTGPVAGNPYRLGKPFDGRWRSCAARGRGEYRALFAVDDEERVVTVVAVAHRRDAYRPP
jgi:mRNA interferase RelE/StbE